MVQWVKATVTKPNILSSIPGPTMVEGENHLIILSFDLYMYILWCVHTHTQNNVKKIISQKHIRGKKNYELYHVEA